MKCVLGLRERCKLCYWRCRDSFYLLMVQSDSAAYVLRITYVSRVLMMRLMDSDDVRDGVFGLCLVVTVHTISTHVLLLHRGTVSVLWD